MSSFNRYNETLSGQIDYNADWTNHWDNRAGMQTGYMRLGVSNMAQYGICFAELTYDCRDKEFDCLQMIVWTRRQSDSHGLKAEVMGYFSKRDPLLKPTYFKIVSGTPGLEVRIYKALG